VADPAATAALREVARTGGAPPRAARAGRPVLVADRVTYSLGGRDVVREVSVTLAAGEVTALLGANGAGKSTLLMGLAGLLEPSGGRVTGGPAGLVFQRPEHQFVARTVADEVAAGLPGRGRRRRATAAMAPQVAEALRRFGLSALAEADPFRLSGGQQRRLSVAAMTVLGHPVLLLDEPTFGLDRLHSQIVADLLRELAAAGTAVAFATHDLRLAAAVADRVAVLAAGSLLATGPTETVLRDGGALAEAGVLRPELLRWWAAEPEMSLRPLLRGLRRQVADNAAGADLEMVPR
jgi:energy-coupling factor transport system ATP-binding protein